MKFCRFPPVLSSSITKIPADRFNFTTLTAKNSITLRSFNLSTSSRFQLRTDFSQRKETIWKTSKLQVNTSSLKFKRKRVTESCLNKFCFISFYSSFFKFNKVQEVEIFLIVRVKGSLMKFQLHKAPDFPKKYSGFRPFFDFIVKKSLKIPPTPTRQRMEVNELLHEKSSLTWKGTDFTSDHY